MGWLETTFADGRVVAWLTPDRLVVGDPEIARRVLRGVGATFEEASDFFGTRAGMLEPRSAQIGLGVDARDLIERQFDRLDVTSLVGAMAERTLWPAAGNALLWTAFLPVLVAPRRPTTFQRLLWKVVETRILSRKDFNRLSLRRLTLRFAFSRAFLELRAAHAPPAGEPEDLLDLVFQWGEGAPSEQLIEIYVAFVFALIGSVGFALGWTVLLACRGPSHDKAQHLVSEALRLFPIAWMLVRRPLEPMSLGGMRVDPSTSVMVSPYAIHRNPRWWPDAAAFVPSRWDGEASRAAWMPFGAGAHACVAVPLSLRIGGAFAHAVLAERPQAAWTSLRPVMGVSLTPPPFELRRTGREG